MAFASKPSRIEEARSAFVERAERPTQADLSVEFGIPPGTIGVRSSEEGWPIMRAEFLEAKLKQADAASVLLEAVKVDRTLIRRFASVTLAALDKLAIMFDSVKAENAAQTQAQALNTGSFAVKNLADAMRSIGILGVSRTLDAAGKMDNGRWDGKLLQQINVNLTGLAAAVQSAQASDSAAELSAERVTKVEPSEPAA